VKIQIISPETIIPSEQKSKGKVMLEEASFESRGLVHYEFIQEGCTVNREMYVEILCWLRDAV
jgi:hypothetical protein